MSLLWHSLSAAWANFHWIRPLWLWALLPWALLAFYLLRQQAQQQRWQTICDPHLIRFSIVQTPYRAQLASFGLLFSWLLSLLALAGPAWRYVETPVYQTQQATVMVAGLSPSLFATDLAPNRLQRARYKMADILQQHQEGQIGMVAFAEEAYTVSPLTDDAKTLAAFAAALSPTLMPVAGSNIRAGLAHAKMLLEQAGQTEGQILLITDGKANADTIQFAKQLNQQGYRINVLGLGTRTGAPIKTETGYAKDTQGNIIIAQLDTDSLQQLAKAGGGRYHTFTPTSRDIKHLLNNELSLKAKAKKHTQTTQAWRDEGYYLLWFIVPLAAIAFRRGWLEEIVT